MNRPRADEKRIEVYRTVTEISDNLYTKKFDTRDLINKSEAYINNQERREIFLILSRYIALVYNLNIKDVKLVFSDLDNRGLITLVYFSLSFVNNQMFPHSRRLGKLNFVVVNEREKSIPTEPIVFSKSINSDSDQTITCYIDKPAILRILEKPIDVDVKFDVDDRNEFSNLLDQLKSIEYRKCTKGFDVLNSPFSFCRQDEDFKYDEYYVTQFVILLIIFTNAYLGYYKLARTDFEQYLNYLTSRDNLIDNTNLSNLFLSYFSFYAEEEYKKTSTLAFLRHC